MFTKFLLAFDGTREGREALHEASALASKLGASVHLVSVVDLKPIVGMEGSTFASRLVEDEEAEMRKALDEGVAELRRTGLQVEATLSEAVNTAQDLAALARKIGADLIVLGHRDQGALARLWNGSVGQQLIAHAPCSVLVAVAATATRKAAAVA
ncbi:MAG: universal stress protein [Alphaproteobacteria bacterium]|nr:universal stress protein [Alphaproteobacteria bacterium]